MIRRAAFAPEASLLVRGHAAACGKVGHRRRGRQRAAVNPLSTALACQLAQIAADGVFRKIELGAQILGDDPAIPTQAFQQQLFALCGQHCTKLHDLARNVTLCEAAIEMKEVPNVTEAHVDPDRRPYRSGTGDDPARMAGDLRKLEQASLPIFEKGHVPMIGEWAALPIWQVAGGKSVGDALYKRILHPTAHRLLQHCDAVPAPTGQNREGSGQ